MKFKRNIAVVGLLFTAVMSALFLWRLSQNRARNVRWAVDRSTVVLSTSLDRVRAGMESDRSTPIFGCYGARIVAVDGAEPKGEEALAGELSAIDISAVDIERISSGDIDIPKGTMLDREGAWACRMVLTVDEQGAVRSVRGESSTEECPDRLQSAIEQSIVRWRYEPYLVDGIPTLVRFTQEIRYFKPRPSSMVAGRAVDHTEAAETDSKLLGSAGHSERSAARRYQRSAASAWLREMHGVVTAADPAEQAAQLIDFGGRWYVVVFSSDRDWAWVCPWDGMAWMVDEYTGLRLEINSWDGHSLDLEGILVGAEVDVEGRHSSARSDRVPLMIWALMEWVWVTPPTLLGALR